MKLNFPNWGYLHYALINEYNKSNPNVDTDHLVKQFKRLEKSIENCNNAVEVYYLILSNLKSDIIYDIPESRVDPKIIQNSLPSNQFVTVLSIMEGKFSFIDEKVNKIFDIPQEYFALPNHLGLNPEYKLYHPEDLPNFLRHVNIAYLLTSIGGFKFQSNSDYCRLKYRIRVPNEDGSIKEYLINKSSFIFPSITELNENEFREHIDYWSVSDSSNFDRVEVEYVCPDSQEKERFINNLAQIYNARLLGISPKEYLILQYWFVNGTGKKTTEKLNRDLQKYWKSDQPQFESKGMSDFLYRMKVKMRKIFNENLFAHELTKAELEKLNDINSFGIINRLGLFDRSDHLSQFVIKHLEIEEFEV